MTVRRTTRLKIQIGGQGFGNIAAQINGAFTNKHHQMQKSLQQLFRDQTT